MATAMIVTLAAVVVVSFGVLTLAQTLDGPVKVPGWLRDVPRRPRQVNVWHLVLGLAALGVLFALASSPAGLLVLCGLVVLVLFAREWAREFYFLMDLRDDDLPGRFDKPVWALTLIAFAPVGLWLFRAYRRHRWSEIEAEAQGKPAPAPDLH
jgi:hypothetical protein